MIRGFDDDVVDRGIFVDIAKIFKEDLVEEFVVTGSEDFAVEVVRNVVLNLLSYINVELAVGLIEPVCKTLVLDLSGINGDDLNKIFVVDGVTNSLDGVVEGFIMFLRESDAVDVPRTLLVVVVKTFVVDPNETFAMVVV